MYMVIDDHYFIHPDVAPTLYVELSVPGKSRKLFW